MTVDQALKEVDEHNWASDVSDYYEAGRVLAAEVLRLRAVVEAGEHVIEQGNEWRRQMNAAAELELEARKEIGRLRAENAELKTAWEADAENGREEIERLRARVAELDERLAVADAELEQHR
ncbi:MAG: hypothetical protein JXB36_02980 [Gammaproteobacteria bacterium]|nr:hypothetical protein [Gammaproteobacteria bacterium]